MRSVVAVLMMPVNVLQKYSKRTSDLTHLAVCHMLLKLNSVWNLIFL